MERWKSVKNRVGLLAELLFLLWSYHNYWLLGCKKKTIEEYTIKEEVVGAYYQSFLIILGLHR